MASFAIMAFTEIYPHVRFHEYVRRGFEPFIRSMAERCLASPDLLVPLLDAVSMSRDPQIFSRDPLAGALGERLNQNYPSAPIYDSLLVAQGEADGLIKPEIQENCVAQLKEDGQKVDFLTYLGRGHMDLVGGDSPFIQELIDWTREKFQKRHLGSLITVDS